MTTLMTKENRPQIFRRVCRRVLTLIEAVRSFRGTDFQIVLGPMIDVRVLPETVAEFCRDENGLWLCQEHARIIRDRDI
jgi:hypothetical protein